MYQITSKRIIISIQRDITGRVDSICLLSFVIHEAFVANVTFNSKDLISALLMSNKLLYISTLGYRVMGNTMFY